MLFTDLSLDVFYILDKKKKKDSIKSEKEDSQLTQKFWNVI